MTHQPDRLDEAFLSAFWLVRVWTSRLFRWGPWVIAGVLIWAALKWREAAEERFRQYGEAYHELESRVSGLERSDELKRWYEEGPAGK